MLGRSGEVSEAEGTTDAKALRWNRPGSFKEASLAPCCKDYISQLPLLLNLAMWLHSIQWHEEKVSRASSRKSL